MSPTNAAGSRIYIGLALSATSSFMNALGMNIQRKAGTLATNYKEKTKVAWWLNALGIFLSTSCGLVDAASYGFAPQSTLAPLGAGALRHDVSTDNHRRFTIRLTSLLLRYLYSYSSVQSYSCSCSSWNSTGIEGRPFNLGNCDGCRAMHIGRLDTRTFLRRSRADEPVVHHLIPSSCRNFCRSFSRPYHLHPDFHRPRSRCAPIHRRMFSNHGGHARRSNSGVRKNADVQHWCRLRCFDYHRCDTIGLLRSWCQ